MADLDLQGAMRKAVMIIGLLIAATITLVVGVIIGGVLIDAVTGGSLNLSTGFNSVLTSLDSTTSDWFSTTATAIGTVVALIVVVVVVKVFSPYIKMGGKGGKGERM